MFWKARVPCGAAVLAAGSLFAVGCADDPPPLAERPDLTVGGEVFHILCKRVARAADPQDPQGTKYNPFCDGPATREDLAKVVGVPDDPRFAAMVERRKEIVDALDQVFGDAPADQTAEFGQGELDKFLADLIPFYDPPTDFTPQSTRAIGEIMKKLLDPDEPISQNVLETLERVAPRVGYRPSERVLGAVRPTLTYPGLDELSRTFLPLLSKDGVAHETFLALLRAGALELAEPGDDTPPEDGTLRAALELLFATDEELATGAGPLWVVDRDERGYAKIASVGAPSVDSDGDGKADIDTEGGRVPTPFKRAGDGDTARYGADGRAMEEGSNNLLYRYIDADKTVLAGLMRDQYPLLERPSDSERSTVEKLARGIRPVLGPTVDRTETFNSGSASLSYRGPEVENSPLLDLVHGMTSLARYPETDRVLALLDYLMRPQDGEDPAEAKARESDALAALYAGLRIDTIADDYPNAKLIGWDDSNETNEFWDDLIQVGQRILEREGMLEAVLRSFTEPESVASTKLIAKFMKYRDHVTYNGAPLSLNAEGRYSDADATTMNSEIEHTFAELVDRMQPDEGMNRSLWQRLISTIHATNQASNCNKAGATLHVMDPLLGSELTFPDPASQPGANPLVTGVINLACPPDASMTGSYDRCQFVEQPNGAETHMRSMLGRSPVTLKDGQLLCLEDAGLAGDLGETQEMEAQITGFTLSLTPQAIARFVHAPRNHFLTDLFDPFPTIHGVPLNDFEPDILFALEARQPDVLLGPDAQSFLTATLPLGTAFDDNEFFEETANGDVATRGYMFAELLATLHKHWPSPRDAECPATVESGQEGCSQRLDPSKPFYAAQSNLVSYEELLIRALEEENLGEILQKANARLTGFTMQDENGETLDGVRILHDFVKLLITPDPNLTYRNGRKFAYTNSCVVSPGATEPPERCDCPPGTVDPDAEICEIPGRGFVGRGRIIQGGIPPVYLVLDALKEIDAARNGADNADRKDPWLQARSELVDHFLTVTRDDTDPNAPVYALKNKTARTLALHLIPWVRNRIAVYPVPPADPQMRQPGVEYRDTWVAGLPGRLADVLGHPATAAGLDLLDIVWNEEKAGAEFAKVAAYLMDPNRDAFAGLVVAAADTLMLIDRDPDLDPLVQFASLALAPNAFEVVNGGNGNDLKVTESAAYTGLELTRAIADLSSGPEPSTISKLLKNAVLPNEPGESPLEILIDAAAEVNRKDPKQPRDKPLRVEDYRSVFEHVRDFLLDKDRGMERLYLVVQDRDMSISKGQAN